MSSLFKRSSPLVVRMRTVRGSTIGPASKINSDYSSVAEQSAIRAGDGGFNVNVQGNTALKGGAITSTQKAISALAGNKAARTADAQTGVQKIFDQAAVSKDINAQLP